MAPLAQNSREQQLRRRHAAPRGRPFKKGQSGNPGGRPKEIKDVQTLARSHTAEAIEALLAPIIHGGQRAAVCRHVQGWRLGRDRSRG
jgi:hypothetical protein